MKKVKVLCYLSLLCFMTSTSALADLISLQIEPIVGYEKVRQVLPSEHTVNRLMYGGRLIAGVLLISAEAEYTRGTIEEIIDSMTQKSTADKAKLGLRSGFRLGRLLSLHVRGGVQAEQEQIDQTVNGVTTTTKESIKYHPYGGAGARAALTSKLTATADVVAVIPDIQNMERNEYQVTAGFAIRLP